MCALLRALFPAPRLLAALVVAVLGPHLPPADASDGQIMINQKRALAGGVTPGDAPGFPVTITKPGSYKLSSDLTVPAGVSGIVISTGDVTLDLNGFAIRGSGGAGGHGVDALGRPNIAVTNGTVSAMGGSGIEVGPNARLANLTVLENGSHGIYALLSSGTALGCTVNGNTVKANAGVGIWTHGGCTVIGNTVVSNGNSGIVAGGSVVSNNVAIANVGDGITSAGLNATITNNVSSLNGGDGIDAACPSTVIGNTVTINAGGNLNLFGAGCVNVNNAAP